MSEPVIRRISAHDLTTLHEAIEARGTILFRNNAYSPVQWTMRALCYKYQQPLDSGIHLDTGEFHEPRSIK